MGLECLFEFPDADVASGDNAVGVDENHERDVVDGKLFEVVGIPAVGVIIDVDWDEDEIPTKFVVEFDDKTRKKFMFPVAFSMGMSLED
jgi:hypothetical protein